MQTKKHLPAILIVVTLSLILPSIPYLLDGNLRLPAKMNPDKYALWGVAMGILVAPFSIYFFWKQRKLDREEKKWQTTPELIPHQFCFDVGSFLAGNNGMACPKAFIKNIGRTLAKDITITWVVPEKEEQPVTDGHFSKKDTVDRVDLLNEMQEIETPFPVDSFIDYYSELKNSGSTRRTLFTPGWKLSLAYSNPSGKSFQETYQAMYKIDMERMCVYFKK